MSAGVLQQRLGAGDGRQPGGIEAGDPRQNVLRDRPAAGLLPGPGGQVEIHRRPAPGQCQGGGAAGRATAEDGYAGHGGSLIGGR